MNDPVVIIRQAESSVPELYRWGVDLIRAIQSIESPLLTAIMKVITALGTEYFYLGVIMVLFWCIDEKKGMYLGVTILISAWINACFKVLLKQPRPYQIDSSVGRAFEPSYGAPSGHAQMSFTFWVRVAIWNRRTLIWCGAMVMILLIGFSRLYLGVHFLTDLAAGWFLAGCILVITQLYAHRIRDALVKGGIRVQLILVALLTLIMNWLYPADKSLGALFLGFSAGYALMLKYIRFSATSGTLLLRCLRLVIGMIGALVLYFGLKRILPDADSTYYDLCRFIRYGLLGLWASAGAPWVFIRLRLAETDKSNFSSFSS
jgi:membrane-associated phospholipid phosphatase